MIVFGALTAASRSASRPNVAACAGEIGPEARVGSSRSPSAARLNARSWPRRLVRPRRRAWLVALAGVHIAVGLAPPAARVSRELALIVLAIGIVLADIAFASIAPGSRW